jgi:Tfp pilus assembly protein PilF
LTRPHLTSLAIAAGLIGLCVAPVLVGGRGDDRGQSNAAAKTKAAEVLRANNLGVAYMDQQRPEDALKEFKRAIAADSENYIPQLNEAIALLNMQRADEAREILEEITQSEPADARGWYNLGLLEKSAGNSEAALAAFTRALVIDPDDADTFYFLGALKSQLHQYPEAIKEFQAALKINAYHVSAEFGLAQAYQRSGDSPKAKAHLERFQHLNELKLGVPMSLVYGEQGEYSLAEQISATLAPVPPAIPVQFADVTTSSGLPLAAAPLKGITAGLPLTPFERSACVFDFDGDGRPDIFLVNATGNGRAALYRNTGDGKFMDVTRAAGIDFYESGIGCAVGDYDNDRRPDLAVSFVGRVALYRNLGDGTFRDVTATTGIKAPGMAMGMTFVDYDHDGDLDLYVTQRPWAADFRNSGEVSNLLWRNNGNGTFTDVTQETGLAARPEAVGAIASDINNDRAIDFIVTGGPDGPPTAFFNRREGAFEKREMWPSEMPGHSAGIATLDFDKDDWIDVALTHGVAPGITLWRNDGGKQFSRVKMPELGWTRGWGIAAIDYDNDGWIDLVAVGEDGSGGKIALLRNEGPAGFRDVTKDVGLDEIALKNPRSVIPFDFDGNGSVGLLITQVGAPPVLLRNIGGNKNHWLELSLRGANDNKSAIGTKVDVFAGAMRQKFEISGGSGYLGQGPTDLHIGLGTETEVDVVRMLWPTGVLQDEVKIAAGARREITEIDRRGSSCPIVFAWNGSQYEFLADMIGPGIVGHWIAPGQHDVPDPDEYLKVNGSQVALRNGRISFRMVEPMEELDYLDRVRLLAVDHPVDVEVYPNEYFASNPPFPEFKVIASRAAHPPAGAWDDRGRDVLPLLLERDRKYAMDFAAAPYQGFAAMHTLTLDLGEWDASRPLRLLMDGFTDYFTANSMYAAWQAGIQPIAPYVEAQDASGKWVRVMDDMGFPAGLARTMIADLTGKLAPGTQRIRISTNLKIYWDRIRVDNSPADIAYTLSEVPLAGAALGFRGYPEVVEGTPKNDIRYVYENVSGTGPYARQIGNYTRYGDVTPLLKKTDEEYVVYGSGDEVSVEFDGSHLAPPQAGWTRDYFFYADGFAKDMDFYAAHGDTVAPLPFHTLVPYPYPSGIGYPMDAEHLRYWLEYNTRPVSGPAGSLFQFQYPH